MPRYTVQRRYQSSRDGAQWGPWAAGQPIDLREDDAAWCNTDSPGLLVEYVEPAPEPAPEPEPEPEPAEDDKAEEPAERDAAPAKDRMHRGGRRRTAGA